MVLSIRGLPLKCFSDFGGVIGDGNETASQYPRFASNSLCSLVTLALILLPQPSKRLQVPTTLYAADVRAQSTSN